MRSAAAPQSRPTMSRRSSRHLSYPRSTRAATASRYAAHRADPEIAGCAAQRHRTGAAPAKRRSGWSLRAADRGTPRRCGGGRGRKAGSSPRPRRRSSRSPSAARQRRGRQPVKWWRRARRRQDSVRDRGRCRPLSARSQSRERSLDFAADRRTVSPEAVKLVMSLFFARCETRGGEAAGADDRRSARSTGEALTQLSTAISRSNARKRGRTPEARPKSDRRPVPTARGHD